MANHHLARLASLIILCGTVFLAACSSSDSGSGFTSSKTLTISVIDRNTRAPITSAKIMLGVTGTPVTVDAQGNATFSGLNNSTYDVHIFASNYRWSSILSVNPADISSFNAALEPLTTPSSEIVFEAGLAKASTASTFAHFIVNNKTYKSGVTGTATGATDGGGNLIYQWTLTVPFAVGTSLSGTLNINEVTNTATGNYTIDYVSLGTQTATTVANGTGSGTPTAITGAPVTLSNPKPATATLATIQSVTPPAGITPIVTAATIYTGTGIGSAQLATDSTQVATYTGYDYTGGTQVFVGIGSIDANASWSLFNKYAVNSNVNAAAQITSLPVPNAGQVGATINWTAPGGNSDLQILNIGDGVASFGLWEVVALSGTATSVTLPTPPAGVGNNIVAGTTYNLKMSAFYLFGLTYAQLATAPGIGTPGDLATDAEMYSASATQATWTR